MTNNFITAITVTIIASVILLPSISFKNIEIYKVLEKVMSNNANNNKKVMW